MKHTLLTFSLVLAMATAASAQTVERRAHLPKAETAQEKLLWEPVVAPALGKTDGWEMPADAVVPGEWEESQAVLMTWVYPDTTGQWGDYDQELARTFCQLYDAIQQAAPVYITVDNYSDTVEIHGYMARNGLKLTNHKFFAFRGNAFWTRDYGPIGLYHNNFQNMDFVDVKYYNGRRRDDTIPQQLARSMGNRVFKTALRLEGGNFISDGYGKVYGSTRILEANKAELGWAWASTIDTSKAVFNTNDFSNPEALLCDGGTGHIDMYMKMMDEETFLVSAYDSAVTASDRQRIEDNVMALATQKSTYDRTFRIVRVGQPLDDYGDKQTSCNDIDRDARGYVNGLLVNNTFIYPTYHDENSGQMEHDAKTQAYLQAQFPGVKMHPIDARELTPMGGALHCITMQLPTDDALRIWHPSLTGEVNADPHYPLRARIQSKYAIQKGIIHYRKKGETAWKTTSLTKATNEEWNANIPGLYGTGDTVQYYVEAINVNGKSRLKPYAGENGPYEFYPKGTAPPLPNTPDYLFSAYPNPANDMANITFHLADDSRAQVRLVDMLGRVVHISPYNSEMAGNHTVAIPTAALAGGVYYYSLYVNNTHVASRMLQVQH